MFCWSVLVFVFVRPETVMEAKQTKDLLRFNHLLLEVTHLVTFYLPVLQFELLNST